MRNQGTNKKTNWYKTRLKKAYVSPAARFGLIVAVFIGSALLTAAVRAHYNGRVNSGAVATALATIPLVQSGSVSGNSLQTRLALQPEADRFRRTLGQRFLTPGHELATISGTLNAGAQQYQVRIVRTQSANGEGVEIALNGGPASLTWNATEGAKSGAAPSSGAERQLIERLALDSPDQFIQAQLRMASYYTIARNVMPAEAHGSDDYNGAVWDVVRVTEPKGASSGQPLSPVRHYFLNSSTGLLEKVVSEEQGQAIVAELSGWTNQAGELLPTHIVWSRNNQVVMEFTVSGFLTGSTA